MSYWKTRALDLKFLFANQKTTKNNKRYVRDGAKGGGGGGGGGGTPDSTKWKITVQHLS